MKKLLIATVVLFLSSYGLFSQTESEHKGSVVQITGQLAQKQLIVNGKPFFIKGVGCAVIATEENLDKYFKLAKEMGANSVRRWGADGDVKLVLDKAVQYGLMVDQGIWIAGGAGFGSNLQYRDSQMKSIMEIVQRYRDHPALLLWSIGNENIENLKSDADKQAFCIFLNDVCERIHQLDPNHPVSYTGVMGQSLKLLDKLTPALDIYGSNAYAAINKFRGEWKSSGAKMPYIFSEYGSDGDWEVKKDENGQPEEALDQVKAEQFSKRWEDYIKRFDGDCLGGYAFLLEEKAEVSETWWGLTYQGLRKASYWSLYQEYTGKLPQNKSPEIKSFHISPNGPLKGGKKMRININAGDTEGDPITYELKAPTEGGGFWVQQPEKDKFEYTVPNMPGTHRLYIIVKDNHDNIATASTTFVVKP